MGRGTSSGISSQVAARRRGADQNAYVSLDHRVSCGSIKHTGERTADYTLRLHNRELSGEALEQINAEVFGGGARGSGLTHGGSSGSIRHTGEVTHDFNVRFTSTVDDTPDTPERLQQVKQLAEQLSEPA